MDKFDVVAAIIIKDDKYFIAQRNRNKHMGLSWEFPGGKVEKGETFEIALKREIKAVSYTHLTLPTNSRV